MNCSAPFSIISSFNAEQNYRYPNIPNPIYEFKSHFELQQAHALSIKSGHPLSIFPLNCVASVCALATPSFQYATQIFRSLDQPEMFVWSCCLRDFAESNSPFDAIMLFYQLRVNDFYPDSHTCSFVIKACIQLLDLCHGRIIHAYVEKLGLQSNLLLQNMILNLYASCGKLSDAILMFDNMENRDIVTWNTMITHHMKGADISSAYALFLQMPERNIRSWTCMIAGYVQCGKSKEAIELYRSMEEVGLKPNEVTVVAVLSACADVGDLDLGIRIRDYLTENGFDRNQQICNTLIDMYTKCGCLQDAYDVFAGMKNRSVVSWSTMIQGLAIHGKGKEALELFSKMIHTGIKPNGVTFISVLTACSHMGMVNEGVSFFSSMTKNHGINPSIEHYGCVVDLLSRAGFLESAYEFIKQMPIKPNAAIWGALLGGCKLHKNLEMAQRATEHINELDRDNDGYYVLLANIYSEGEQWEDAAKVRKLMKTRGVKKTHGLSWINVKGRVHEFVAGDESHPEITEKWEELVRDLRLKGYVPNTGVVLMDMEEEVKERVVLGHSEKLALVFGLINAEGGGRIRIFKNLRVCEDCHAWFKLVSEIEQREIVMRDRNRFHCFKDGVCSCGDYW